MRRFRNPDEPMWVVGCIDSYGEIRARVVKGGQSMTHTPSESKGKRWRWNIWGQEYHATRNPTLDRLSGEETGLVSDWLERHGHKEDTLTKERLIK